VSGAKRKLIEVALPLEAINRESAREKSIRHGHPSTLHLWWARRPLAACRAVLFAQLVDDPSAHPDRFPTDEDQAKERRRLFDLIEKLVVWENTTDEALLKQAHAEIAACFEGKPPAILDPFAGGGSIPLEAQRLGLEAHASDLNPVAVLINKALIEIPPKFAGQPPVFPGAAEEKLGDWPRATGLAEDVRRYGQWMRNEAKKRIGRLYPKAKMPDGREANVIAWIWARTVTCPNPACGIQMPLVRSWWLGKKKGKEAYVTQQVGDGRIEFSIGHNPAEAPTKDNDGTVTRNGAICVACGSAAPLAYVRAEGKAKRMSAQLMAIAAEGHRRREYLAPTLEHEQAANVPIPDDIPDTELPEAALGFRVQGYGMTRHADLFTHRQLTALTTFSDIVKETRKRILADEGESNGPHPSLPGYQSYADAVATYLGQAMSRVTAANTRLNTWNSAPSKEGVNNVFKLQTLSMTWDYAESNPFVDRPADLEPSAEWISRVIELLPTYHSGEAAQANAGDRTYSQALVATDPPYYDNVGYSDLSDFFYVWLRRSLGGLHASLLGTVLTPKGDELVADPFRRGGDEEAERYFEAGFVRVFDSIRRDSRQDLPITVFYAFKQAETDAGGTASTGWEVLLQGMIRSGWRITATWPIRTERTGRPRHNESNALASSVVLACRPRPDGAPATTRRAFLAALAEELPAALKELQQGSIAPVDLAQAAIGPGMAIFSRYAKVVEPDGSDMTVRMALALINQALDEVLTDQEGDFDSDTRFCVKWFTQFGWDQGDTGTADTLSRATNTSVGGLERGGVFWAKAGKARLLRPDELSADWDPATDDRVSVWEVVVRLAQELQAGGIDAAAGLMAQAGQRVDLDAAKELAYLLFSICGKRKDAKSALLFNSLGTSWSDLSAAARTGGTLTPPPAPDQLDFDSL
jgi:putative DNA methylase